MRTADQPIRISLFAPRGRMGQAIAAAVGENPGFAIDHDRGDVLLDFSTPNALHASLDRAISGGIPILIGTTGLGPDADRLIAEFPPSAQLARVGVITGEPGLRLRDADGRVVPINPGGFDHLRRGQPGSG